MSAKTKLLESTFSLLKALLCFVNMKCGLKLETAPGSTSYYISSLSATLSCFVFHSCVYSDLVKFSIDQLL